MNKERRKRIEKLLESVGKIKDSLQTILEEEQEAFDNLPESFQDTERGERMQNAIDGLESAVYSLEETEDCLTGIE